MLENTVRFYSILPLLLDIPVSVGDPDPEVDPDLFLDLFLALFLETTKLVAAEDLRTVLYALRI